MSGLESADNMAEKLRDRLKHLNESKSKMQRAINDLNDDLKRTFTKSTKRPRESMEHLEKEIAALEYRRTTTSLNLADEKKILREITAVQRTKSQLEEYRAIEQSVQDKKAQLASLRDNYKSVMTQVEEVETALAKLLLAESLGCTVAELSTETVQCPSNKLGRVIGKSGANIKQITKKTKVTMDVNSSEGLIQITGSRQALEDAKAEINLIIRAAEVKVEISEELLHYLTSKHVSALAELREKHPDVIFEIPRNQMVVFLRGLSEHVQSAKSDVVDLEVSSESIIVTNQETGIVVGRRGITIDKLVKEHNVMVKVENSAEGEEATVTVIGPAANVKNAFAGIKSLLSENRDVAEQIQVDTIIRNTLLMDNGSPIKQLQRTINEKTLGHGHVMLSFGDQTTLTISGKRAAVDIARSIMEETIALLQASIVTIQVEPGVVPRIIGKGGSTIRDLQKQHKGVVVELDSKTGKIQIHGSNHANIEALAQAVKAIVAENQLRRLPCPPGSFRAVFRDLMKEKGDELKEILSSIDFDESSSEILLRGTTENTEAATAIVEAYLANNYVEDVDYDAEDEPALVSGGKDCLVSKLSAKHDVSVSLVRAKSVVVVRGKEENVAIAAAKLRQFLLGGEGHVIHRLSVSEQAIGVVVGKGGSKRAELEAKHEGVSIFIHRSNRIAIRGPVYQVESCRIEILGLIATAKVHESVPITEEQRAKLTKPRQILRGIPVDVTVTDDAVKVRGISADVKDALALLKEELTGVYETRIELDASQMSKLRSACKDPGHFDRIHKSSHATISLDLSTGAVVISGKRRNVSKAKMLVMDLLDFVLPSHFAHLKISKPLHTTVGSAASLADVSVQSGASVSLDRDVSMIYIQCPDPAKVEAAVTLLKPKIEEAEKLVYTIRLDPSESWLISLIIGKGGQNVAALRAESGCQIDVSKEDLAVTVSGTDVDSIAKARETLEATIEQARRECVFVEIPPDAMAAFLGRSWKHIKGFAERHGVEMDRLRKDTNTLKITGPEENVEEAQRAVASWIVEFEDSHASVTVPIKKASIPAIVGKEGSVIAALQRDFDCRIEIDREASTLIISGGNSEKRNGATYKINEIIAEDQEKYAAAHRKEKAAAAVAPEDREIAPQPVTDDALPSSVEAVMDDARKNRSSEFAALPVGLTIEDKSRRVRLASSEATPSGTAAGRNLFDLLVSDSAVPSRNTRSVSLLVPEENWDSSTVSSAVVENSSGDDDTADVPVEKSYYKSASGFTVRI